MIPNTFNLVADRTENDILIRFCIRPRRLVVDQVRPVRKSRVDGLLLAIGSLKCKVDTNPHRLGGVAMIVRAQNELAEGRLLVQVDGSGRAAVGEVLKLE